MSYSCEFDLSLPHQLIANQNAYAFRSGSILAKQKMRMTWSKSKMAASIGLSHTPRLYFSDSYASWLHPRLQASHVTFNDNLEGQLTNSHKNWGVPGQICGSYREIFVLKLQDSSGMMNFVVSWCNHRIANIFRISIALPSCYSEHNFNTFGIRAVLSLPLFFTLRTLTRVAPESSLLIILGPGGFPMRE